MGGGGGYVIWLDELFLKISEHQTGNPNIHHTLFDHCSFNPVKKLCKN